MNRKIRLMEHDDIDSVLSIQSSVYHDILLESSDFYFNRLSLAPEYCWVAENQRDIVGYLISYPWTPSLPPELDLPLTQLPDGANCWFIHDCAVSPQAQGLGISAELLDIAGQQAVTQGLTHASLVSLSTATEYWYYQGYKPFMANHPDLENSLADYGDGACYMAKTLL